MGQGLEQVLQVGEGLEPLAPGRLDHGEEDRARAPRGLSPKEEPVFRAKLRRADRVFHEVVVDLQMAVFQEPLKAGPLRDGIAHGFAQRAFGQVDSLLNTADEISPGNPLSKEVRGQLRREQQRARQDVTLDGPGAQTVALPASELSARSDAVVQMLTSVAQRIREHQLRVVIVARTDSEGRWVYSQLRQAVPGYRVRGDIKLGNPPRLLLQKSP